MNIIILSHERSLNKAEGLLKSYIGHNVYLIVDSYPDDKKRPYVRYASTIIRPKNFNLIEITSLVKHCDKIWCVSENLLPVQSQLESYYGISNMTPFAAEILSNKQLFDDYCRDIGLGEFVPRSVTPTFHNQLKFKGEFFTKPDIGTGNNVFFDDEQNAPNIEYRRWNNKHHFLSYLKQKGIHNKFFDLNKNGIHTEKFNNKPCRIMAQQYYWSETPPLIPTGYVKDGIVNIVCYLKTSKVKYGDVLDPSKNPIELHSNSRKSDIGKDIAVWIVDKHEIEPYKNQKIQYFLQNIVSSLDIKEIFFAGPDFHMIDNKMIAIDFNPRPGQFMNILDHLNDHQVMKNLLNGEEPVIRNKVLWGCAMLKPGIIRDLKDLSEVKKYFNAQNIDLKNGMEIPEFQNLQNKKFYINLDITGRSEEELFNNYKKVNQLLQDCITY